MARKQLIEIPRQASLRATMPRKESRLAERLIGEAREKKRDDIDRDAA